MPDNHGPIEKKHLETMRALGQALDSTLNGDRKDSKKKYGFCLLVFNFGDVSNKSRMNYISNSNRPDMIKALEEFINNNRVQRNKPQTNDRREVDNLSSPLGLRRRKTDIRLDIEFP